jgi:hypothetical protein
MDTCAVFGENKMEESHDMKNREEEVHQFQKRVVPEIFLSNIVTIGIFLLSFYDYLPWQIAGSEGQKHVSLKDRFILSLILCTILRSSELILLPTFTFLFILGRFTFALGYPNHRSFGMTMNFISILLVTLLIAYRFFVKGIFFQYISWK